MKVSTRSVDLATKQHAVTPYKITKLSLVKLDGVSRVSSEKGAFENTSLDANFSYSKRGFFLKQVTTGELESV